MKFGWSGKLEDIEVFFSHLRANAISPPSPGHPSIVIAPSFRHPAVTNIVPSFFPFLFYQ
jgi:hypothetical protein